MVSSERGFPQPQFEVVTSDRFSLPLGHYTARRAAKTSVLLLHGASASSRTFFTPVWRDESRGIVDFLRERDCDVWTLDWRGGADVGISAANRWNSFTMDHVAEHDIPAAVEFIRKRSTLPLSVLGHCVGAATLAMSLGGGFLRDAAIRRVVLMTIGLFYEVTWDGWVKADDRAIERALIFSRDTPFIHWNVEEYPWPSNMEEAYRVWPKALLPRFGDNHPFRRLTFMFGRPFLEEKLPRELLERESLALQFGAMPMSLYIHAGQNVRRGFAAPFDDTSWPAARYMTPGRGRLDPERAGKYFNLKPFEAPERVTLITGDLNVLWHQDSIHRMHEWLRRGSVRCEKYVVPGYAHQDLLWSRDAREEVYPLVASALGA